MSQYIQSAPYTATAHMSNVRPKQGHNRRDEDAIINQTHIDRNGDFEIWQDEPVREAYEKLFSKSVEEYNQRQKRSDRRIENYYTKICHEDKGTGCKHPEYEMYLAIGNRDNPPPDKIAKKCLKEFYEWTKQAFPHLYTHGFYYHGDEEGVVHAQWDFIPYSDHNTRGMNRQVSFEGALREDGLTSGKKSYDFARTQFLNACQEKLREIGREHGLEMGENQHTKSKHIEKEIFILQQKLESLIETNNLLAEENRQMSKALEKHQKYLKTSPEMLESISERAEIATELQNELERTNKQMAQVKADNKDLKGSVDELNKTAEDIKQALCMERMRLEDAIRESKGLRPKHTKELTLNILKPEVMGPKWLEQTINLLKPKDTPTHSDRSHDLER